jgi:hypothetical protein
VPLSNPIFEEVVEVLSAAHQCVTCNEYGAPVASGFTVVAGPEGTARISHTAPQPDLLDPDRPTDDDIAAERHRMVDAYAATSMSPPPVQHQRAERRSSGVGAAAQRLKDAGSGMEANR